MWDCGVNTQIWVSGFKAKDLPLVRHARDLGYDAIEVSFGPDSPGTFPEEDLRKALQETNLRCTFCGFLSEALDISSKDGNIRDAGVRFFAKALSAAERVGAELFAGPLYAPLFRSRWLSDEDRELERQRSVASLKKVAKLAEGHNVKVALEPLNRFETDMLNTVDAAVGMLEEIGSTHVGLHFDTFHMDIEEVSIPRALARAGKWVIHFHASENDRGVPGTGHVPWEDTRRALRAIQYEGLVVVEGFNREDVDLSNGARIWRDYATNPDDYARRSLQFLRAFSGSEDAVLAHS